MTNKKHELETLRRALNFNGGGPSLNRVVKAGCNEKLLLALLKHVPEASPEQMSGIPDWLTVAKLDHLLRLIRELDSELHAINTTSLGTEGTLTKYRFPNHYLKLLDQLPACLRAADSIYDHLRDDLEELNPKKDRMFRSVLHATLSRFVFVSTGKRLDGDVAQLLEAAYRSRGIERSVSPDALKKFRERHRIESLSLILPFLPRKSARKLEKLIQRARRGRRD